MVAIHFNTIDISEHTGYGKASRKLVEALEDLPVHFSESADIVLNFCMPKDYKYGSYTIGYTPWESTKVPDGWLDNMMKVDELWAPSSWTAKIFSDLTGREVFVLPHGIDDNWFPVLHRKNKLFTYIHVGEPAVRKGGEIVLNAWYKHFWDRKDIRLIYKCTGIPMARVKDEQGSIIASPTSFSNIQVLNTIQSPLQMWRLYCESDVMVYPTRGEGFGFIPLEAMCSGLPTIVTNAGGTADFANYGTPLNSNVWKESDEAEHPGQWIDPSVSELAGAMKTAFDFYTEKAEWQFQAAKQLKEIYQWSSIARTAYERLTSI